MLTIKEFAKNAMINQENFDIHVPAKKFMDSILKYCSSRPVDEWNAIFDSDSEVSVE